MSQPTLADHALVVLIGIVVPLLSALHQQPAMKAATYDRAARAAVAWNGALSLAILGCAVLGAWWYREGSLEGLGLGPPRAHLGLALALSLAFATAYALATWWHSHLRVSPRASRAGSATRPSCPASSPSSRPSA